MKKVIFGAAALLFSGALLAQNTSTSTQTGDDERVYVRQAGTNLTSTTTQAGAHNKAMVWQKGVGNTSTVDQEGTNNQAYVDQKDFTPPTNATATINQGKVRASDANKAMIRQHGGTGSVATFNQDGDLNEAQTHQDGTNGIVNINQDGTMLKAEVQQSLLSYSAVDNVANIDQLGTNNQVWAKQDGNRNDIDTDQSGLDNKAEQRQTGDDNEIALIQNGTNGRAKQVQIGNNNQNRFNGPSQSGSDNYSDARQVGNDNDIFEGQDGTNNSGWIRQNGNNNYSSFGQYGANGKSINRQIGNGNSMIQGQFSGTDSNLASSWQKGDDNTGIIQQYSGLGNQALLVQKSDGPGLGHTGGIYQTGNGNMADVLQLGPGGDFAADAENCDFLSQQPLVCPTPIDDITIDDPCAVTGC
ncbi:hypothetical protein [Bizionia paragorgiae]|uniref:hypothetical protein n=1 Tax=Bizionia paragorgiae TaxID=283786 RepID=UPI00299EC50C|nr:hypothetical protein [Bizionia paragorgiae]MDX1271491.1 hypothetical protein [Bizionia paragorgiae]